ncbi:MAG: DNA repair protein RadC [Sneathiella sp.]|nr:DNA repair protein RadC [Sneathiella sp.]
MPSDQDYQKGQSNSQQLHSTAEESSVPFESASGQKLVPEALFYTLEESAGDIKGKIDDKKGHRKRLREKVINQGAAALADYEFLEMILFATSARADTKPLAKKLITKFGSLSAVLRASHEELLQVDTVTDAIVATLKVAELLGEKLLRSKVEKKNILSSWQSLLEYCQGIMGSKDVEHFRVLFLNNKNHLIADELQQKGTVNQTAVYPREVVKRALELGATSVILVHNHPSGDTTPSKADISMTNEIVAAAAVLGIRVLDHLVVSANESTSLKSLGLM